MVISYADLGGSPMRIWIYGGSPEEIQEMIEKSVSFGNTVSGTSLRAETDSSFPQSGLIAAISAAMRGEFDLLQLLALELLGNKSKAAQMVELFQNYGVSVRSVSSRGINSSWYPARSNCLTASAAASRAVPTHPCSNERLDLLSSMSERHWS